MIIAMPVEKKAEKEEVCISFGRTPYFLIYNSDSKEKQIIENSAVNSAGGAGVKAAQLVVDRKANVLLTPRCGENAAEIMIEAGIKLYKTSGTSVDDNISTFLSGGLNELKEIHPGYHGQGDS